MEAKYKRILLKLSGESLMGKQGYGIDSDRLASYAAQIAELRQSGVEVGIVIVAEISSAVCRVQPKASIV